MSASASHFEDSDDVFDDDNTTDITSATTTAATSTTTGHQSFDGNTASITSATTTTSIPTAPDGEDTKLASWGSFKAYMIRFGKNHTDLELEARFEIFKTHVQFIEKINANKNNTFKAGLNHFSDIKHEDFQSKFLGYAPRSDSKFLSSRSGLQLDSHPSPSDLSVLPASVDWNAAGAVTPVMNQGTCGSCWAFSSTGAIEGARQIKTGILTSLSQQELVDCGGSQYQNLLGCGGGDFNAAFEFVTNNGLDSESSYGYVSADGKATRCTASSGSLAIIAGELSGYTAVQPTDNWAMMSAVASQPVSIAIDADNTFQHYESGVYNGPCGSSADHAVLMIGYGSDNGNDYWLVKNSWGTGWGEEGFVRMKRDIGTSQTGCYFFEASYPVVTNGTAPGLIEDTDSCFHTSNMSGFLMALLLVVQLLFVKRW